MDISCAARWLFTKISRSPRALATWSSGLKKQASRFFVSRDACEICQGRRGGVKGNENRVHGRVMCDYCHAEHHLVAFRCTRYL